jgi:chromate transporter
MNPDPSLLERARAEAASAASLDPRPPGFAGGAFEVFRVFLGLGLTSFGGPMAHIAYFRAAFVERRGWIDAAGFAQLLALCQFLPGPASSQLGFAIGLQRAGLAGALAAFVAFTAPSALLLFALAALAPMLQGPWWEALLQGLKLVAVCAVAHALLGMARSLCRGVVQAMIALAAAAPLMLTASAGLQLVAIAAGAALGAVLLRTQRVEPPVSVELNSVLKPSHRPALLWLLAFALLLLLSLLPSLSSEGVAGLAAAFYRVGALVFGGGHVVLPLLQEAVVTPGWLGREQFLAGYGAAQVVPGPMFSLAAFLGAGVDTGAPAWLGALVAVAAVFLPGFLLLLAVLPFWQRLQVHAGARAALAGVNAAVVGLLGAAFVDPVLLEGVRNLAHGLIALAGFALLQWSGRSPLWMVVWCVGCSVAWAGWGG